MLLTAAIGTSILVYGLGSGATKSVWILPDELGYGLLARSLATTGHFSLRGTSALIYPLAYPALIAPAFVGRSPVAAYDAAKWLNAVLMSLAAVPVFLIARRLVSSRLALLAAALTLLIPSMAYTRVIMSENAFFPVFLLAMLVFIRALEKPTTPRQLAAVAAIVPVVAVRAEGVILLPILLAAMIIQALSAPDRGGEGYWRSVGRELRRFRTTWIVLPAGLVAVIAAEAAAGKSPTAALGRYAVSVRTYPVLPTLRWSLYQLVDLELYVAVVPLLAACIALATILRSIRAIRPQRAVASVASTAIIMSVLTAGAASASVGGGAYDNTPYIPPELHDRYCFFVVPFFLVLFVYWVARRPKISTPVLLVLIAGAAALPLVLPYAEVHGDADYNALALLPWSNGLVGARNVHYAMAATALLLSALAIPRRRSIALLQVGVVVLAFLIMGPLAASEIASASTKVPSNRLNDRSWVDESVPGSAEVAVVWRNDRSWSTTRKIHREQALWRAEFFNSSIGAFFYVGTTMQYNLPISKARIERGRLELPRAGFVAYRYVLAASTVPLAGRVVARDQRAGLILYRLERPAVRRGQSAP